MKESKLQLVITGGNWEFGGEYSKITIITTEQFEELEPVIEAVMTKEGSNWAIGTDLVKDNEKPSGWKSELKVYGMYRKFPKELMRKFVKRCPDLVDSINEVRLQKVVTNDIKSYIK